MARYRILYWGHIPIGVKATDINGTVRENLPHRFQEAFGNAALANQRSQGSASYTTSNFRWGEEEIREGTASAVAAAISKELDETWNEEEARASYEKEKTKSSKGSLDLRKL